MPPGAKKRAGLSSAPFLALNGDGTIEFLGCEYQMEIPAEMKDKIQTDENGNETIRVLAFTYLI